MKIQTDWISHAIKDLSEMSGRHPADAILVDPRVLRLVIESRMKGEIVDLRAGLERANAMLRKEA